MRIHIDDLEHEIEKAQREREVLIGKRNEVESVLYEKRGERWLLEKRLEDLGAEIDDLEDYLQIIEDPDILEPCSSVARAAGCTCQMADYNPPEPIRSRYCPLHGSEPDEDER